MSRRLAFTVLLVVLPTLAGVSGAVAQVVAGTMQFSAATYSVDEKAGTATVRVTRTGAVASNATVEFRTTNGTATAPADYLDATQVLTFAAGQAFKDVLITIVDGDGAEGNRTVVLTLSNPSPGAALGTLKTAVLTIRDEEQGLQFSAPVYVVNEATPAATITVVRTGPTVGTVTVDYASAGASATSGADYTSVDGTLTFGPGVTSRTFTVPIINDTLFEAAESVALLLNNPTGGAQLGPRDASTITIVDNDVPGAVRFSAAAYMVAEAMAAATITVQRTPGATASAVTVNYATVPGGTATEGADYLMTSGTLTFKAGEVSKTFTVPILNDKVDEPNETVNLALSNPTGGATLGTQSAAVLTITDDDVAGAITFSAPAFTVPENAGLALIKVNRTGAAGGVTVEFTTADGTAAAPADYTATNPTLSFAAGEMSKTVPILIAPGGLREGNETVRLVLSNPTGGATLGTYPQAVLTITDNETGPTVQFGAATYTVAEHVATGVANVTITRTGSTVPGQTVLFSASPGTAGSGIDFTSISNQLVTFSGTQASVIVPVTILNNSSIAGSRTVNLTLSSPGGGLSLGVPRTAVLTILEDDATVQFASATYSVTEGAVATLAVTRTGGTLLTAMVNYAMSPGSATAGADYAPHTGTLVFGPGVTSQTITVPTTNDTLVESPETFTVTLSSPRPATSIGLGSPSTATVTITDNDAFGLLQLARDTYSVTEGAAASLVVTRTGGSAGTVTVQYATSNGGGGAAAIGGAPTASGTDYATMAGTLTFLNGVTSRTITVPTKADTLLEGPETFTVTLSSPGGGAALGAPAAAVVTIVDDETPRLQFATASYTVAESAGSVTLTVQRVGPTTTANTVEYALAGVTATGGGDFANTNGVLTFAVGVASRTIVVPIINDTINEGPETFTVTLSNPSAGALLGTPAVATVTITDNDPAGVVQFSQVGYAVIEGEIATITVTRTGTSGPVTVNFATNDGTALAPDDYTAAGGTLTFQPGETTKTFTIATALDSITDGSESVNLTLSGATSGLVLGSQNTATLWILGPEQSHTTFYVAPTGNDLNPGTIGHPFRTIAKARDTVRTLNGSMSSDITVYLRGGEYALPATLEFTQVDSGSNGFSVIYKAYPGERPLLTGGQRITGWTSVGGGIYRASVPVGTGPFRQLYANGVRAIRARTPNVGAYHELLSWDTDGLTIEINESEISDWQRLDQVEMVILGRGVNQGNLRIASFDIAGSSAVVTPREPERTRIFQQAYPPKENRRPYFFENAYEFLDAPGEWYLDTTAGEVFYMPRPGESIGTLSIVVPRDLETLLRVRGDLDAPVHHLQFVGITFEHTTWLVPNSEGYVGDQASIVFTEPLPDDEITSYPGLRLPGAIHIEAAHHTRLERNVLRHLGGSAVNYIVGTHDNQFVGNLITDVSGSGVSVALNLEGNPDDSRKISRNDVIRNNYIEKTGRDYYQTVGIMAGYTDGIVIEHNELHDMPYSGISVGWGWANTPNAAQSNLVRYNRIWSVLKTMADGGGIYTLSLQPGTLIAENYITDIVRAPWLGEYEINGVFCDVGSSGITVSGNVFQNIDDQDIRFNNVGAVILSNNGGSSPTVTANAGLEPAYRNVRP